MTDDEARRTVLMLSEGNRATWTWIVRQLPDIRLVHRDYRWLEGRGGLPSWVSHPYRPVKKLRPVARTARRRAVEAALRRRLTVGDRPPVILLTDQEVLSPQRASNIASWMPLLQEAGTVLNHPITTLRRLALLEHFHATGRNSFRAWRASDPAMDPRFPCFVRAEADHFGPRGDVAHDRDQLHHTIRSLVTAGHHPDGLLVVEKAELPTIDGLHAKYGAARVGDHVFPRSAYFSKSWVVKSGGLVKSDVLRAHERAFVEEFAVAEQVRDRFEAAGVQYGRIDFGIVDGRVETFEINTNPYWMHRGALSDANPRSPVEHLFLQRLRDAFAALP